MISNTGWRQRRGGESSRRSGPIRSRAGRRNRLSPTVLILEDRRLMTTVIPVTSALDTGPGTLRDAIIQADSTAGRVEIDVQLPNGATIGLTQGQLELSDTGGPVSIVGPGAGDLTIDAGGATRVLEIDPGVTAMVSGLTLSGGWTTGAGGGVHNRGAVTLSDVVLSGNTGYFGGGMENDGTATLVGCTISGNTGYNWVGGGVSDYGPLRMVDSTISGNTGIWALTFEGLGTSTLDDCLVSANSFSGVLDQSGAAGALTLTGTTISDQPGTGLMLAPPFSGGPAKATLTDCTVRGNGYFGVWNDAGTLSMDRCSISGNSGAGLLNWYNSTASVTDCTVSGNQGSGVENDANITLTRCRISGNTGQGEGGGVQTSNYPGQSATLTDCILSANSASLYGGGVFGAGTMTMSGCIITGNVSGDGGGGVWFGLGTGSISGSQIAGNTAAYGGGINVANGDLTLSGSAVTGNTARDEGGGLEVDDGSRWWGPAASVTMTDVIVSGDSATTGGGIFVGGTLAAMRAQVAGNAAVDGGGIANAGALTLDRSNLVGNSASHDGGGLLNHATATLTALQLSANSAGSDGGGVFDDGLAALSDCTITGNTAATGGGIYVAPTGSATLARTKVRGNRGGDIAGTGSIT